mmetsp:Transcript_44942/g.51629  ORF Transcript_44942/g.51629 Transcript_44942/m.51629 type:complete len:149 (-) Transcript_44942:297-743(-)
MVYRPIKPSTLIIVLLLLAEITSPVRCSLVPAKKSTLKIYGKLVTALVKCAARFGFTPRLSSIGDPNKIHHIMNKAGRGFENLDPESFIWEALQFVAPKLGGPYGFIFITLVQGTVIAIRVACLEGQVLSMGTAYFVDKVGDKLLQAC